MHAPWLPRWLRAQRPFPLCSCAVKPQKTPVVTKVGSLAIASQRFDLASFVDPATSTPRIWRAMKEQVFHVVEASTGDVTFKVPPLPPSLLDGIDRNDTVDASLVQWEVSPWVFDAGAVDSYIAGLTLTLPSNDNSELEVHDLEEGREISFTMPRKTSNNTANRFNVTRNTTLEDECVYLNETFLSDENRTLREWSSNGATSTKT